MILCLSLRYYFLSNLILILTLFVICDFSSSKSSLLTYHNNSCYIFVWHHQLLTHVTIIDLRHVQFLFERANISNMPILSFLVAVIPSKLISGYWKYRKCETLCNRNRNWYCFRIAFFQVENRNYDESSSFYFGLYGCKMRCEDLYALE